MSAYYTKAEVDALLAAIKMLMKRFTAVDAGSLHTCGLKQDGTVPCWGENGYGQSTPPGGVFAQVSAAWNHTCGLKADSTVACWGRNDYGQSTPPLP